MVHSQMSELVIRVHFQFWLDVAITMSDVQSITKRLDNLPSDRGCMGISPYYMKLLLKSGVGWAMDSMDTFVFIYLGLIENGYFSEIMNTEVLANGSVIETPLDSHQRGILGSAAFAGSLVGSFLFGQLADVYGRKTIFMVTLLVFMLATVVIGASKSYGMLLAFRFIAGFGLGGELPVAAVLVQELTPSMARGRIIVLLESFWSVGCMIAVLLSFELTQYVGWRIVFYVSAMPALWAVVIRFWIPESPKWLASVGRIGEAETIVDAIEHAHGIHRCHKMMDGAAAASATMGATKDHDLEHSIASTDPYAWTRLSQIDRLRLLFTGELTIRTIVLWIVWTGISFSYFSIFIWLPILRAGETYATGEFDSNGTAIFSKAFDINGSTATMFFIIFWQLPGYFSAAYVVEILGRKITLGLYLLASFVSVLAFGYVVPTQANMMATGACISWFMLGSWGALYAYTPENYPTQIRAMGSAYPGGVSRIGATVGSYMIPILLDAEWNIKSIMWLCGGVLVFVSFILFVFGYETRGEDVESVPRVNLLLQQKLGSFKNVHTPGCDPHP
jgi:putative MFS transporter